MRHARVREGNVYGRALEGEIILVEEMELARVPWALAACPDLDEPAAVEKPAEAPRAVGKKGSKR